MTCACARALALFRPPPISSLIGQFALESTNAYSSSLSDWSALETLKEGGMLDIKVVVAEYLGVSC